MAALDSELAVAQESEAAADPGGDQDEVSRSWCPLNAGYSGVSSIVCAV